MDAIKIYEEYFKTKKDVINQMLNYYKDRGKKIALWGAGKKGQGFLNAFDLEGIRVDYIYDKDKGKYGQHLENGQEIVDYHEVKSDVILVANSVFELEVVHLVKEVNSSVKIINLDNIILGDLQLDDVVFSPKLDLTKVRENKICAVVVLYHPDLEVVANIESYVDELDQLYLYDNSEVENEDVINRLSKYTNITYINRGVNLGLPIAFNEVAEMARNNECDWMITFDQDSIAQKGMIVAMREYVDSEACDEKVGIVAPVVNEIDDKKETQDVYSTYCDKVIQSGAMHNLKAMQIIGNYDEKMFIDEVDNEYCARCIVQGYKIVKLNNAILMHNQQDEQVEKKFIEGTTVFIDKFSPDRYYYRYRNALYCYDIYKDTYPLYALDCLNTIRKMKLQLNYDTNYDMHKKAIEEAIADYKNGMMGKREN